MKRPRTGDRLARPHLAPTTDRRLASGLQDSTADAVEHGPEHLWVACVSLMRMTRPVVEDDWAPTGGQNS